MDDFARDEPWCYRCSDTMRHSVLQLWPWLWRRSTWWRWLDRWDARDRLTMRCIDCDPTPSRIGRLVGAVMTAWWSWRFFACPDCQRKVWRGTGPDHPCPYCGSTLLF